EGGGRREHAEDGGREQGKENGGTHSFVIGTPRARLRTRARGWTCGQPQPHLGWFRAISIERARARLRATGPVAFGDRGGGPPARRLLRRLFAGADQQPGVAASARAGRPAGGRRAPPPPALRLVGDPADQDHLLLD